MTKTSAFKDKRTQYTISETFSSETDDEMRRRLRERLLQLLSKKLAEANDKLDNNRPI